MIDLYTWATPNGRKVSIMLEALGLPYQVHEIDITAGDQFQADFIAVSPNNKIPAIVDPRGPDGKPIRIFESGAILIYLAEKYDRFLPREPRQKTEVMEWLMWQMGGFGPFLGQAHHFNFFAAVKIDYAVERYNKEAQRLWQVLNDRLGQQKDQGFDYVCEQLSIADFAIYPWATRYQRQNIEPKQFPHVHNWMTLMASQDFVQKGMAVPGEG